LLFHMCIFLEKNLPPLWSWWKLVPLMSEKLALIWKAYSIGCLLY
jgi:hypothetical protein